VQLEAQKKKRRVKHFLNDKGLSNGEGYAREERMAQATSSGREGAPRNKSSTSNEHTHTHEVVEMDSGKKKGGIQSVCTPQRWKQMKRKREKNNEWSRQQSKKKDYLFLGVVLTGVAAA
jgi:hypothetical protein